MIRILLRELKHILRDQLGVPPWLALATAGLLVHVALNAALRRPMASGWGLLGPLVAGIALESFDIWVQYRHVGLFAPGNDPLLAILGRHSLDVLLMLAGPLLLVLATAVLTKPN